MVETDIADCFSAIPHEELMRAVEERVCDQAVLKLLRAILRAGVMEDGQVRRPVTGAAQGGVISPLLCNVYLHRIDRVWDTREHGVLVRFADDVLVMCRSREQAETALQRLRDLMARGEIGLDRASATLGVGPRPRLSPGSEALVQYGTPVGVRTTRPGS